MLAASHALPVAVSARVKYFWPMMPTDKSVYGQGKGLGV
jgi:hypothetical protein